MYRYAMATKINENLYEVFRIIGFPETATAIIERLENAINSKKPITGMKTTQFGNKISPDAVWNGNDFINSDLNYFANANWEIADSFSFLCDNKIILIGTTVKNTIGHDMLNAAFDNEVTLVKINNNEQVDIGYLWNTKEFIKDV